MNEVRLKARSHATQDRLTRGARVFAADVRDNRILSSPPGHATFAERISQKIVREGSRGDTMHKLFYVHKGYLDIEGGVGGWLVLPGHMIFVPADRAFNIASSRDAVFDIVHLDPASTPWRHHGCWVTRASPLAREMIGHAVVLSQVSEPGKKYIKQNGDADHRIKFRTYIAALALLCSDWFKNSRMLFLPSAQSGTTSKLITYLRDNIATASVEDAARHVMLPQRTLLRHCVQEFGFNLRTLIREIKIILAMELLSSTDMPVGDVAHKVGFSSLSAFTSAFSSRIGLTPRQYIAVTRRA